MSVNKIDNVLGHVIRFSILVVVFCLPLSSGLVNTFIAVGLLALVVQKAARGQWRISPTRLNLFLLLFFAASCISMLNSIEPQTSIKGLVKVLKFLSIFFLMVEGTKDKVFFRKAAIALAAGAAIVSIDGIIQYFTGRDIIRGNPLLINLGIRRITAAYRHSNDFGIYLVSVAPFLWSLGLFGVKKPALKRAMLSTAALVTICVGLSFSRGAALAFYVSMLTLGLVKKNKLIIVVLALALLAVPFLLPKSVYEWGSQTKSPLEFFCNTDRIAFYRSSIEMIKDHPVIGVGVNTFVKAYPKYKVHDVDVITGDFCYAHNNYLQMAGEIGLLGLGVFLLIMAALFLEIKGSYQKSGSDFVKNAALGLGCGVLAFLLNGLTESSFYFSKIVVVFWVITGLAVSLKFMGQSDEEYISSKNG
ncbi:MAG: O-antigen ligase family protein [Candidatus Omnitrophota bacterium]